MQPFRPKDFNIFVSLQKHFGLVRCALKTLRHCTGASAEASTACIRIQNLERDGDEILRHVIQQLDRQLTNYPLREAIRHMFYRQDRILDAAEHLAGRFAACGDGRLPDAAVQLVAIVESCAAVLQNAIRAFGEGDHFVNEMGKMADLENEADRLYIAAIRDLAGQEADSRRLLILHEMYGMLEKIVNLFEDCIQTMEDAALETRAGL